MMDIGNNFFMLKFNLGEDKNLVMDGGPWMVFDHYLAVQLWTPEFVAMTATINKTMMWIRFPGLNLYFYDESVMLSLATTVGRPIKVDANTLDVKRGKFARVCVEVDMNKPMIGKVWMRGHWYMMEYEGLHCICSDCGCSGHFSHECMSPKPMKVVVPPPCMSEEKMTTTVTSQPQDASSLNKQSLAIFKFQFKIFGY